GARRPGRPELTQSEPRPRPRRQGISPVTHRVHPATLEYSAQPKASPRSLHLCTQTGGSAANICGPADGHGEGNAQGGSDRRGSGAADRVLEGPRPASRGNPAGPSGARAPRGDAPLGTGPRPAGPGPPAPRPTGPGRRGDPGEPMFHVHDGRQHIALTIDDGPSPEYTPQVLRLLEKYRV